MRLFAAIQFSKPVLDTLMSASAALRQTGSGSFPRRENLHLTLAFLGETDRLTAAKAALTEAVQGPPFPLTLSVLGHFRDLYWVGIANNPQLSALAAAVQSALRQNGFDLERRSWQPHITLVRRYRGTPPAFQIPETSMTVHTVSLMRSDQINGRRVYTELASYPLQ